MGKEMTLGKLPKLDSQEVLRVGMELKNRARVVASKVVKGGWIVFAVTVDGEYEPYVTWFTADGQECYHGHYFDNIGAALADLVERV